MTIRIPGNQETWHYRSPTGSNREALTTASRCTSRPMYSPGWAGKSSAGRFRRCARSSSLALIRSLPKELRRHFVPAPDTARAVLAALTPGQEPLLEGVQRELHRRGGVLVPLDAFDLAKLPAHLRVTFAVEDDAGNEVARGKDLAALQEAAGGAGACRGRQGGRGRHRAQWPCGLARRPGGAAAPARAQQRRARGAGLPGVRRRRRLGLDPRVRLSGRAVGSDACRHPTVVAAHDVVAGEGRRAFVVDTRPARARRQPRRLRRRPARRLCGRGRRRARPVAAVDAAGLRRVAREGRRRSRPGDDRHRRAHRAGARAGARGSPRACLPTRRPPTPRRSTTSARSSARCCRRASSPPPDVRDCPISPAISLRSPAGSSCCHATPRSMPRAWPACKRCRLRTTTSCARSLRREPSAEDVRAIGWQLEELRVSLWAQQLGTPRPVSEKRIFRAIDAGHPVAADRQRRIDETIVGRPWPR